MKLRKLIYLLPVLMVPMISVPILMTSCSDENTKQENNNTQGDSNNSNGGDNSTGGGSSDNDTTPPTGGGSNNGGNDNTGGGGTGSGGSTGDDSGTTGNSFYEKYKHLDGKDVRLVYSDVNNNANMVLGRIKLYPTEEYFLIVTKDNIFYDSFNKIIRLGEISDSSITEPTNVEKYQGFKGKNVKVTFTDNATLSTGNLIDLTNDYVFLGGSGHYGEAYSLP